MKLTYPTSRYYVSFVMHGSPKQKGTQQIIQWTKSLGVPAAATYVAIVLEFFGGLALIS